MFGDIKREEGLQNAKEEAALEEEELLVGARERQEKKTAPQNERKFLNNWPQPWMRRRRRRPKRPSVRVMVALRQSGEKSAEGGVELVEE